MMMMDFSFFLLNLNNNISFKGLLNSFGLKPWPLMEPALVDVDELQGQCPTRALPRPLPEAALDKTAAEDLPNAMLDLAIPGAVLESMTAVDCVVEECFVSVVAPMPN
jgi:hypothetical protein